MKVKMTALVKLILIFTISFSFFVQADSSMKTLRKHKITNYPVPFASSKRESSKWSASLLRKNNEALILFYFDESITDPVVFSDVDSNGKSNSDSLCPDLYADSVKSSGCKKVSFKNYHKDLLIITSLSGKSEYLYIIDPTLIGKNSNKLQGTAFYNSLKKSVLLKVGSVGSSPEYEFKKDKNGLVESISVNYFKRSETSGNTSEAGNIRELATTVWSPKLLK